MREVSAVTTAIVRWVSRCNGAVSVLPLEQRGCFWVLARWLLLSSASEAVSLRTWRLLIGLFAVIAAALIPAASTGAGAEDMPAYDPRVSAALDLLDKVAVTSDLRGVLATNQVQVRFLPMTPGVYARYSVARQVIEIDDRWTDAETTTLAAVLAHEATHASDAVSGYLATGGTSACIDSEVRAFRTSALFWIAEFGAAGKPEPTTELDRQMNSIAERQLLDPQGLDALVRETYTQQCNH